MSCEIIVHLLVIVQNKKTKNKNIGLLKKSVFAMTKYQCDTQTVIDGPMHHITFIIKLYQLHIACHMLQLLWHIYSAGRYFNARRLIGNITDLQTLLQWVVNVKRSCNLTYTSVYKERPTFILKGWWIPQEQPTGEGKDVKSPLHSVSP